MSLHPRNLLLYALLTLGLGACATATPPKAVSAPVPAQWSAPLPMPAASAAVPGSAQADPSVQNALMPQPRSLTDLTQWWRQQGDPLLAELVAAAQAVSPTVATARSRIEQSRAARVTAGAVLAPSLDASAGTSRGRSLQAGIGTEVAPIVTTSQAGLQASWEIDVFGANRAGVDAASERLASAEAQWHDARVSVAAETANQYYSLRSCRQLTGVTQADAASRQETARLSSLSTQAGFTAPATNALARASAFDASGRAKQQAAQCELSLKALVALSGLTEPDIKQKLALAQDPPAQPALLSIASVPAQMLAQRPDVFSAQREVAAASADVGQAQAQRYPSLSLTGSIGASRFSSGGQSANVSTWSIGPLAVSLPLFDGGRRVANVQAAEARYIEAAALYRAKVRQAVSEVEQALVTLQSTAAREADAQIAVEGYRAAFTGAEALYQGGLGSLVALEDVRRSLLAASLNQVSLQGERLAAWVALYRALGGGWTPALADDGSARVAFSAPASAESMASTASAASTTPLVSP